MMPLPQSHRVLMAILLQFLLQAALPRASFVTSLQRATSEYILELLLLWPIFRLADGKTASWAYCTGKVKMPLSSIQIRRLSLNAGRKSGHVSFNYANGQEFRQYEKFKFSGEFSWFGPQPLSSLGISAAARNSQTACH